MGPRPTDRTIDRINNNRNYTPSNCRWSTRSEQQSNRRVNRKFTVNGITRTLEAWAALLGTQPNVIGRRLDRNWDVRRALTTPPLHVGGYSVKLRRESKIKQQNAHQPTTPFTSRSAKILRATSAR